MRIIISPAKKMNTDTDNFAPRNMPRFLTETDKLLARLRELDHAQLQALWRCNDALAVLNENRVRTMDLRRCLTPAIFAYEGIQYRYMAPGVLETAELAYLEEHLRILSGFYGVLRPFDGVTPYRLELQAKLRVGDCASLYDFWGDKIASRLFLETDTVLNLASKEYSKCIAPYVPKGGRFITCTFAESAGDKITEKGTACKMARGEMVRFLAEENIRCPEDAKRFDRGHYRFCEELSTKDNYIFLKGVE